MEKKVLGISWLNGEVRAVAFSRGSATGEWASPKQIDENGDLAELFRAAATGTRFDGRHVFMIMAHRRLAHQLIETPPVRGLDLELFVERRAAQLKTFEDDCVTSFHPALPTKSADGIILNLFPKAFLTRLSTSAQQAGLHLTRLYPTVPALCEHLKKLPIAENEAALLAAENEGITTVVIGRKDGSIALARSLTTSWRTDADRVISEINRSMLFVKQQTALSVESIWLFGGDAERNAAYFSGQTDARVQASPVPHTAGYWIESALQLPVNTPDNLLSRDFQKAGQRRAFFKATAILSTILLLACGGVVFAVEALLWREAANLSGFKAAEPALLSERQRLEAQSANLDAQQKVAARILGEESVPIPFAFAGYVAANAPGSMVLTHVELRAMPPGWLALIKGRDQEADLAVRSRRLAAFERMLAEGSFRLHITNSSRLAQARGDTARRHPDLGANGFFIEGTTR